MRCFIRKRIFIFLILFTKANFSFQAKFWTVQKRNQFECHFEKCYLGLIDKIWERPVFLAFNHHMEFLYNRTIYMLKRTTFFTERIINIYSKMIIAPPTVEKTTMKKYFFSLHLYKKLSSLLSIRCLYYRQSC